MRGWHDPVGGESWVTYSIRMTEHPVPEGLLPTPSDANASYVAFEDLPEGEALVVKFVSLVATVPLKDLKGLFEAIRSGKIAPGETIA